MYSGLIKTEQQYTAALVRLEALMGAAAGTPEADELELLALLIGTYEDQRYPQELPTPAEAIRFRMEQLGLRQKDLVPYLGSASRVSEVLNGKRELTLSMMRALHEGLGIPAAVLLRQRGGQLPDNADDLEWQRFPVRELGARGWLPGGASCVKERAEEIMREYLRPLREAGLAQVMCRASVAGEAPAEVDYALLAWIARIVAVAAGDAAPSYRPGSIDASFLSHLVQLSSYDEGPLLAKQFLHRNGIVLVVEPHLRGTRLDGAAIMTADGVPIIGLTLRYDRVDHFWFTLLHELGHVARHLHGAGEIVDREIGQRAAAKDPREREADLFAEDAIADTQTLRDAGLLDRPTAAGVEALATALRVHPALVAGRVRKECGNYRLLSELANAKGVKAVWGLET
jgi:HTH-type transcriptional regulator/antitoxin HigA